ncbi:MAG: hypothetical protein PHV82_05870 [Victivallaceae bacterium]|nr:hypothetical protein [Victivallaceae bacterium]
MRKIIALSAVLFFLTVTGVSFGAEVENLLGIWKPDAINYSGKIAIYLNNNGNSPLTISAVKLDGKDIGCLTTGEIISKPIEFRKKYLQIKNPEVLWYRVWPNPVPAKGICEVTIRLQDRPKGKSVNVAVVPAEGQTLNAEVPLVNPEFRINYVSFSDDLKTINVYLGKESGKNVRINSLEIDGKKADAVIYSPAFYRDVCYIKATFDQPLKDMSSHFLKINSENGGSNACVVTATPAEFILGALTNWNPQLCRSALNQYLTYIGGCLPTSRSEVYDYEKETQEKVIFINPEKVKSGHVVGREERKGVYYPHPRWRYFLGDEPDGRGNWPLTCREMTRATNFCRILDPTALVSVTMDHSGWPKNCYAFGGICDCIIVHTFAHGNPKVKDFILDHMHHARLAGRPFVYWYLTGVGPHYTGKLGFETQALQAWYSVGNGGKGFFYYPLHDLFHQQRLEWFKLAAVNFTLHLAGSLLAGGDVWPLPVKTMNDVDLYTIGSGDRAFILFAANKDYEADRKKGFSYAPIDDVLVDLTMPEWFKTKEVFSISAAGIEKLDWKSNKNRVSMNFSIGLVKMIILAADPKVREELSRRYEQEIKPRLEALAKEKEEYLAELQKKQGKK